jgi:hypothetical protein
MFAWAQIWLIWLVYCEKNTVEWLIGLADNLKRTS